MRAITAYVNAKLPADLRDPSRILDSKGVGRLLAEVADRYPERYSGILKMLGDTGRKSAYVMGETVRLEDLEAPFDKTPILKQMLAELDAVDANVALTPAAKKAMRKEVMGKFSDALEKQTMDAGNLTGNSITRSVASGARGKPLQVKAMIASPGVYADFRGNIVPVFSAQSYAEGLRPAAYLASTYGARAAVVSTKAATARGGDIGKQMSQTLSDQVVTTRDCGTANGIDLTADDPSVEGRVLQKDVGSFPAGTFINSRVASALKKQGGKIVVRSALTCQAHQGVCAKCAGASFGNKALPDVGTMAGIRASQALSEPVTQGSLNVKHCILEGTKVRMADMSTKAIERIEPGDMVLGSDINGNAFPVRVLHKWNQGMQDVLRIEYAMGQTKQRLELFATADHPVLSNKKTWSKHNFVKFKGAYGYGCPKDFESYKLPAAYPHKNLGAVLPVSCTLVATQTEDLAWLCGILLGDGIRYTGKGKQSLSCAEPEFATLIDERLAPLGLTLKKSKRSHDWRIANRDWKGGNDKSKSNQLGFLREKIRGWGLIDCYAHEKKIPEDAIRAWSNESVGALLGGMIATDGSVYKSKAGQIGVSFCSTSRELLDGVKFLLEKRLCVYTGSVTKTNEAGQNNYVHDMWALYVTRLDQVKKLHAVCRIPGRKGEQLKIEIESATYEARSQEPFFRALRKSVTPIGKRQCWDITVEHEDELFVLENGLVVKNTSGAYKGKKSFSGLNAIEQFVQAPAEFPDRAAVAELDGHVDAIEDAPQGGKYIIVDGEKHYVLPDFEPIVKVGDKVEAGDQLSGGLVDPKDKIRLQGIGAGRLYYAQRLKQILDDSGHDAHLRNTELMARGAIDHVEIDDDGYADFLPADVASYNTILSKYAPPETAKPAKLGSALGKYLAAPVLHYTIGTRVTPSLAKRAAEAGYDEALVDDSPPAFKPVMTRLRTQGGEGPDWIVKQTLSYVKSNLMDDAARGRDTNIQENIHYAPRQAVGVGFGDKLKETGKW